MDPIVALVIGWLMARGRGRGDTAPLPDTAPAPPRDVPWPEHVPPRDETPAPAPAPKPTPTPTPTAGKRKGVEVWQVKPEVRTRFADMPGGAGLAQSLWPGAWEPVRSPTLAEVSTAKALLPEWRANGVEFRGPMSLADRRAYRMVYHSPAAAEPPAPPKGADKPPQQLPPPAVPPQAVPERAPGPAETIGLPTLRQGPPYHHQAHARRWQEWLGKDGFPVTVDGKYGPKSTAATVRWQRRERLKDDGVVGAQSWSHMANRIHAQQAA